MMQGYVYIFSQIDTNLSLEKDKRQDANPQH